MTRTPGRRFACAALVAVLAASGCTRPPSTGLDDDISALLKGTHSPRTVDGRTYTAQPLGANLGLHRFMFPANLSQPDRPVCRRRRDAGGVLTGLPCRAAGGSPDAIGGGWVPAGLD